MARLFIVSSTTVPVDSIHFSSSSIASNFASMLNKSNADSIQFFVQVDDDVDDAEDDFEEDVVGAVEDDFADFVKTGCCAMDVSISCQLSLVFGSTSSFKRDAVLRKRYFHCRLKIVISSP